MKIACFFFLLLLINGGHHAVECRRHRQRHKDPKLFVFGDSFVDAGGRPRTSERSVTSRAWFHPYGMSDSDHGNRATGRVSDGLVQSDILAMMLGSDESPLPYRRQTGNHGNVDPTGVNFAVGGSGVFDGEGTTSLATQIDQLKSMLDDGSLEKRDMKHSVALVAISTGHDYSTRITHESSTYEMRALSGQVTDELAAAVKRLQDMGVDKVLVNLLPPLGCNPWQSVATNYTSCQDHGNSLASIHNDALRDKLDSSKDVLLLDLYTVFDRLQRTKLAPCCNNPDPDGYCGQVDSNGKDMYTVCDNPEDFFFWDYVHPTQSAWEDIMERLQGRIEDFLGIESSW